MTKTVRNQYEVLTVKLWSPLQRQLAACGQTQCSPQQWLGIIRNLQKKGVSTAEIEWSGVILHLESQQAPKVLIGDLLSFLSSKPPCELVLQRHITDEYAPVVRYVKQERPAEFPPESIRHGHRQIRLLHYLDPSFGLCIWLHVEVDTGVFGRHKYWTISLPSGRKHLPSFKNGKEFISASAAMAYGRKLVERMALRLKAKGFVGQPKSLNKFGQYVLTGGHHYTEWLITAPNLLDVYEGPHFEIENLVAHVRTTERITTQGHRLLVLEETQSDWNQELRKAILEAKKRQPPANPAEEIFDLLDMPPLNPYQHHWLDAALRMMLLLAAQRGFDGIAWLPGRLHAERFPGADSNGLEVFYDQIVPKAVEKLAKPWGMELSKDKIGTLSHRFGVRKVSRLAKWQVIKLDSGQVIGEEFSSAEKADEYRWSKEKLVLETVSCLLLSPEMREDLRENGLPYLGAVEKRLADNL